MNIQEFLADYGSTTQHFKNWSDDYALEVLYHGFSGDKFQRIVIIFVDKIPVMLGLSETEIINPLFLDILQNAGQVPIGLRLFAADSGVKRVETKISQLETTMIKNKIIVNYLANLGISGLIYFRQSNFIWTKQSMTLKEYILPGLIELLAIKT